MSTKLFYVEMTDTFGGEANYAWVRRFMVKASTPRGAMRKVGNETGYRYAEDFDMGDVVKFNSPGACVCFFVNETDGCEREWKINIKDL